MFGKKVTGCVVFIGSKVRTMRVQEMEAIKESKDAEIRNLVLAAYGNVPFDSWCAGLDDENGETVVRPVSEQTLKDIRDNGFRKSDEEPKRKLFQQMQNFMVMWYSRDLKNPQCIYELSGGLSDYFVILCPIY